jgi:uncharacterized protein YecE (DUF72 family)
MDFGHHSMLEMVQFSLPCWNEEDVLNLKIKKDQPTQIFIGSTTWNQDAWVGNTYPHKTPKNRFLSAYGASFDTLELNSTHYNIPPETVIKKWCEKVPETFRFCPKAPQFISHRNDLGVQSGYLDLYLEMLSKFENKLGLPFIQFPPYLKSDRLQQLVRWVEYVHKKHIHAIEFRHESWFENQDNLLILLLKNLNWPLVITDTSGRRDLIHMRLTSTNFIIRFVACGIVSLDQNRLDEWVDRLYPLIIRQQLSNIYFFMHDPEHYTLPDMAFYLKSAFHKKQIEVRKVLKHLPEQDSQQQLKLF